MVTDAGRARGQGRRDRTATRRGKTVYKPKAMSRLVPLLAALVALAVPAAAAADPLEEVVRRDLSPVPAAQIDAAAAGPLTRTLAFQHRLADDVPFADAPWTGTHNSFNSIAEMGPLPSPMDGNQRIGLVDQLRLGVRSLELDLHGLPQGVTVCHGVGPVGCSVEKSLRATLEPIAAWLRAHPREVLLLYLEDQIGDAAAHDAAAATVRAVLGDRLWTPQAARGCTQLPLEATRAQVRAAGAQVVVVGSCGTGDAWPRLSFAWDEVHVESRPRGFRDCAQPGIERADYTRIVRFFEDSTFVNTAAQPTGATTPDDGLTPETVRAMVTCGVDLLGFDQLLPDDPRLEALVFTWAPDEPRAAGACARVLPTGRWATGGCSPLRRAACRRADGSWVVPRGTTRRSRAARLCRRAGAVLAAPRTGAEGEALRVALRGRSAWLGLRRSGGAWMPTDRR